MATNSRQSTTHTYTLRQLLGEDITIVIPDLQRDFCWGDGDKASAFVRSVIELYRRGRPSPLGLLYGYESPAGSGHIHIIDGQQRITTLYLLAGMLYRRLPRPDLRRMLISDYELIDDREPRLLYEVRTEAMYFMSELVTHFFLDRDGRLSQLEKSAWYCSTYSTDPTVRGFIRALRMIDDAIESVCNEEGWDFGDFTAYVTDGLTLIYHDLGSREAAEAMFVTINTTGEPLTLPQRLKARLAVRADDVKTWEEAEQWAWLHRSMGSDRRALTSDTRLEAMIHIWEKYSGERADALPRMMESFGRFLRSYAAVCEYIPELTDARAGEASEMFVLLPAIRMMEKWNHGVERRDIAELTAMLRNITRYRRISPAGTDTESACRMVDAMATPSLMSLLGMKGNVAPKILSEEELAKLRVIAGNPGSEHRASSILHKGENHPLLYGNMHKVIAWSYDKATGTTDMMKLRRYIDTVYEIWGGDIDCNPALDPLRRAMLTLRHSGYPLQKRADATLSLCWYAYEWQRLMALVPGAVRQIIDRVAAGGKSAGETFEKMIKKFEDKTYAYYFLIAHAEPMASCTHRSLLRYCKPFIGYYVTDKETSKPVIHWTIDGRHVDIDTREWTVMRPYGSRCLYTDHRYLNIAVDIHYLAEHTHGYRIEVFGRDIREGKEPVDLRRLMAGTGRKFSIDRHSHRYFMILPDSRTAVDTLRAIMHGCR